MYCAGVRGYGCNTPTLFSNFSKSEVKRRKYVRQFFSLGESLSISLCVFGTVDTLKRRSFILNGLGTAAEMPGSIPWLLLLLFFFYTYKHLILSLSYIRSLWFKNFSFIDFFFKSILCFLLFVHILNYLFSFNFNLFLCKSFTLSSFLPFSFSRAFPYFT